LRAATRIDSVNVAAITPLGSWASWVFEVFFLLRPCNFGHQASFSPTNFRARDEDRPFSRFRAASKEKSDWFGELASHAGKLRISKKKGPAIN